MTAWTVIDSNGELLARFIAGSPREVGRKVVRNRYDPFRFEVSPSYRELFDREVIFFGGKGGVGTLRAPSHARTGR